MKIKKIVVVSPAYNVAGSIENILESFLDLQLMLQRRNISLYLHVFNDCSGDETPRILEDFYNFHQFFSFQTNPRQLGNTGNRFKGYQWIFDNLKDDENTIVVFMDSDGEHSPLLVPFYLSYIEKDENDVVIGSVAYPEHRFSDPDYQEFRPVASEQSRMLGLDEKNWFYSPAPGFQIHRSPNLKQTLKLLFKFQHFYQQEFQEDLPIWGMPFVVLYLAKINGAQIKTVYLPPLLLERPNRDPIKKQQQLLSYQKIHKSHVAFAKKFYEGK